MRTYCTAQRTLLKAHGDLNAEEIRKGEDTCKPTAGSLLRTAETDTTLGSTLIV